MCFRYFSTSGSSSSNNEKLQEQRFHQSAINGNVEDMKSLQFGKHYGALWQSLNVWGKTKTNLKQQRFQSCDSVKLDYVKIN